MCQTNLQEAQAAVEAILFAASFPLTVKDIAAATQIDEDTVGRLLRQMRDRHSCKESGIVLSNVDGSFILMSRPEYAPFVENLSARPRWVGETVWADRSSTGLPSNSSCISGSLHFRTCRRYPNQKTNEYCPCSAADYEEEWS